MRCLAQLGKQTDLVTLSYSVDYWNYLGWHDTLSSAANSERQREYARVRGDGSVYTPQIVVDGMYHVNGSNEAAIEMAIRNAAERLHNVKVPVAMHAEGDTLVIGIGAAPETSDKRAATVWLAVAKDVETVSITRGENQRQEAQLSPPGERDIAGRHVAGRGDDAAAAAERVQRHGRRLSGGPSASREWRTNSWGCPI